MTDADFILANPKLFFDSDGNLFSVEVSSAYEPDSFEQLVRKHYSQWPNSLKYTITGNGIGLSMGMKEAIIIDDIDINERVLRILKSKHGILDFWDHDPSYFAKK